ncbi:hypothetical protein [Collinsella intestinalis]|uniref:hypothetical protein n=1 Tax=Collinsella intestinalis TaxID=147207 RepID=UPI0022E63AF2|nr:hypothetical protein [Collinsella intestinalis]
MRTVALRFAENFAPDCGTIAAHRELIEQTGHVWYGKLGGPVSYKTAGEILDDDDPRILLIHSGGQDRWWAHVEKIQRETPPIDEIPSYYRNSAEDFGCWFKVVEFEPADRSVMSQCVVASSGRVLSSASRHSMSPYFIIDYAAK